MVFNRRVLHGQIHHFNLCFPAYNNYRMMTNGLTDIKTTLFLKTRNCQAALQKLLEEQSDIRQHLRATNRYV